MTSRYNNGTSLNPTNKEFQLELLEKLMGELSDELFIDMKKLRIDSIKELRRLIKELKEKMKKPAV